MANSINIAGPADVPGARPREIPTGLPPLHTPRAPLGAGTCTLPEPTPAEARTVKDIGNATNAKNTTLSVKPLNFGQVLTFEAGGKSYRVTASPAFCVAATCPPIVLAVNGTEPSVEIAQAIKALVEKHGGKTTLCSKLVTELSGWVRYSCAKSKT
jgi:hypothetical protein